MTKGQTLGVLPLRNLVLFPGSMMPVDVGRPRSLALVDELARMGRRANVRLAVGTQKDPDVDEPAPEEMYTVGTISEVVKVVRVSETRSTIVLRGIERCRLVEWQGTEPYLRARVEPIEEKRGSEVALQGLAMAVKDATKQLVALAPDIPDEVAKLVDQVQDPAALGDVAASHLDVAVEERIQLLEETDVETRLHKVLGHLRHRIEVFRVKEKIDSQVRAEFTRHQREAVLRQKLKAIQEELGESEEGEDLADFEESIAKASMPPDAEKVARKQLDRLRQMPAQSPEYTVTRTYLEWLVELPWAKTTEDHLDLAHARQVLDEDHYDLEKVKKRILEYLAVRKLKPDKKGPILALVGPPGVGKTSLGRSIARALGRQFVRISLGGVRDEAEVRGHRRTYIGALPGRIVQGLRRAAVRNPVFMLDEIDKLGTDFRGDPAAALLEALDPEQNNAFSDHYIEVPFDLSQVIFIGTANWLEPIPPALKDRLEVLELPGYTRLEKLRIARTHLVPKQLKEHGLDDRHVEFSDESVFELIDRYTREAGVRNLEREIAAICRAVAVKAATGEELKPVIEAGDVGATLGPHKFWPEVSERTEVPGVATGLAWTEFGGEILFVEATAMPGKGGLTLTGHLGDVMKESATAALTYVRARAERWEIDPNFFEKTDVHVHVPSGGVPKDGPSAGVAMISALVSLLTGRRVRSDVAMTGELTLRGSVMPIGGVKEKVLAAHRAGIRRVFLPELNRKDMVDIPEEIRGEMELTPVSRVEEVLDQVLEPLASESAYRRRPTGATPQPGTAPTPASA